MSQRDVKPTDRNLLVGALAVQLDFVSAETLVDAINRWVVNKATPLEEILVSIGAIEPDVAPLLNSLVAKHLTAHAGDLALSLAAIDGDGAFCDSLTGVHDKDVQATVASFFSHSTRRPDGQQGPPKNVDGEPHVSDDGHTHASDESSRFRILRSHARGGLGEVSVALDRQLNREVALKEIQAKYAHDDKSRDRFVLEAEVTGGLEHPGVVPVYGLGRDSNGRPYYAMRFVRGESLQQAVDAFHSHAQHEQQSQTDSPFSARPHLTYDSDRLFQLRRLLSHFIDVCQTMEYAHSRGILHRDLKPANIMLGKYGETLVVDWGLAKAIGREDPKMAGEVTLAPQLGSASAPTQMGSTIGTPSFMSPEQAEGKTDAVSPRSDVYSLGATLYYLLVGQAPLSSKLSLGDLLQRVKSGKIPATRELIPTIPRPLDAICGRAMALNPSDRYSSPKELAEDLERWLADEPVSALKDSMLTQSRRWLRRHRTLATTLAAVGIVSLCGFAAYSTLLGRKNLQLAEANKKLEDQTLELRKTNEALRQAKEEATEQTQIAEAVNSFLTEDLLAQASPNQQQDRDIKLRTVLDQAAESIGDRFQDQPTIEATICHTLANVYRALGELEKAEALYDRAAKLMIESNGEEDAQTLQYQCDLGLVHQQRGQFDRAEKLYDQVLATERRLFGEEHAQTLLAKHNLALLYQWQGRYADALKLDEEVLAARRRQFGPEDPATLATLNNVATLFLNLGNFERAEQLLQEAIEISRSINGEEHPHTLISQTNRSNALMILGRFDESEELLEDTIEVQLRVLGKEHLDALGSRSSLAALYRKQGKLDESRALSEELLAIRRRVLGPEHPDTLVSWNNLALIAEQQQRYDEAEEQFEELLKVKRSVLGETHPDTLMTLRNLAVVYEGQERFEDSARAYLQTLEALRSVLGDAHPVTKDTLQSLAKLYFDRGDWKSAVPLYEEMVRQLDSEKSPEERRVKAGKLSALAQCYVGLGAFDQAMERVSEAIAIRQELEPDSWFMFNAKRVLGAVLTKLEKYDEAERSLLNAYEGLSQPAEQVPPVVHAKRLREAVVSLIQLYQAWDRPEEREKWQARLQELES